MKCVKCKKIFDYLETNNSRCTGCKEITKENKKFKKSQITSEIIAEKKKILQEKNLKKKITENLEKYPDGSNADAYVSCALCGLRSGDLSTHVSHIHGLKIKEYTTQYGSTKSKNNIDRMKGEKNPFLSRFCESVGLFQT